MFMEDHRNAVAVLKNSFPIPDSKPENFSTSLLWVVSGMTTLTKVNIYAYVHKIFTLDRIVVPETTHSRLVLKFSGLLSGIGNEFFKTATALRWSSMNIA